MAMIPMLQINENEEVVHFHVSGFIPGTGFYKFLSKQKEKGGYEWVHFVQRVNGDKENILRGHTQTREEVNAIMDAANLNLNKFFGPYAVMKPGSAEMRSPGMKPDDSIN